MRIPRNVLAAWADLGRYPELLLLNTQNGEEGIPPAEALAGLLNGLVSPRTHREGFAALLERGEYRVAESLLTSDPYRTPSDGRLDSTLAADLSRARQQTQDEVQLRIVSLGRRAGLAGLPSTTPAGIEEMALNSRERSADLLREWEARIKAAETRASGTLFQGDPGDSGEAGPDQVPRRPLWPWVAKGGEVLRWYTHEERAPADFHARWRHGADDTGAKALLGALGKLQDGVTVDAATTFATAVDAFLGHEGHVAREGREYTEGIETRLFALTDWRLPCLGASGVDGVRLWIPRSVVAGPPPVGVGELVLCFSERLPSRTEPGLVWFDLASLLRLLPERKHRLENFLRDIGSRIPLSHAIPVEADLSTLPALGLRETGTFVRWVLDILNVKTQDAALPDMIVYYSGGKMGILLPFLRSLLESHPNRQIPLTQAALVSAWEGSSFREPAQAALLQPLTNDPLARAALGGILYFGQPPEWKVTPEEVVFAIEELSAKEVNEAGIRQALERMALQGLFVQDSLDGAYRPPTAGIVTLLLGAISDPGAFVKAAMAVQ